MTPDYEAFWRFQQRRNAGDYTDADRMRDFKAVFGTAEGERVLCTLVGWAEVYQRGLATENREALEGRRALVLDIFAQLTASANEDGSITTLDGN